MRSIFGNKLRFPGLSLLALAMGIFWACQVSQDGGHTYLNIDVDSSFTKYDKVVVVVTDSVTGKRDTVFNKHLAAVSDLSKIPIENYQGQKVNITITGFQNGQAVYQEARQYDGKNPDKTNVVIVDSVTPVTSVQVSPHSLTLRLGGSAKEISAVVSPAQVSQAMIWSTSAPGIATVQPKSGDATHALVSPVAVGQAFIVVASQKNPGKTDTVSVAVVDSGTLSSNAKLSALTVSTGPLNNPAFSPDSRVSGETVPNSVTSLTVTATLADTSARLIINGAATASGTASSPIALNVGQDSIFIVVTAQDGSQKTYALGITRAASSASNNLLYSLTTSSGPLTNPVFNSNSRVSGALVANSVDSITVTATLADTVARLTINGTPVGSGMASSRIPLNVGVDSIFIIVTAQDGTQLTYAVAITRAASNASSNANLAALTVSSGPLNNPAFDPAKRVSGASVANVVNSITVTATVADSTASLIINGTPTASGTASAAIPLVVGVDSIYIVVTAQSAAQKTYAIAITRAPGLSSNANLAALTISAGALNAPAFSASSRVSGATVANSVTSTTVTATVADTTARLTINGTATASGAASAAIPLAVGADSVIIVVTAQDSTKKTYAIAITRSTPGLSSNANLATLTISAGTLNAPAFNAASRVSGASVANSVTSTTVTATVADTMARLTIGGTAIASGTASAAIPLAVGVDSVIIVVTAQDESKNTYAIGITRAPPVASSNANLATLTISAGTLNAPAFNAASRVSGAAVANSVTSTTVTATVADTTAKVTIGGTPTASGVASAALPLAVGVDSIFVVVTAQDGSTTKTYAVGITRAKSSNANLATLTVSAGALNAPAFSAASRVSGAAVANSVTSTTVTATLADTSARLTINSVATGSGVASAALPLAVGVDSIFVVVTAQDGSTTKTYAIGLTRAKSSNANLSALSVSAGLLNNPAFDPTKRVSGMVVGNGVTSTTVTATVADTTASLTVGGTPTGSGATSAAQPLAVGVDSIFVVVTAQDGSKNTYAIGITRAPSSDASLAALAVTPGSISPAFAAGITAYTVNYTTETTVSVKATPTQAGAAMTWNGTALTAGVFNTPTAVGYGNTVFNLIVTAPDGVTTTTYKVTVARVDNVPPNAPLVNAAVAKVYIPNPSWSWTSGGGGNLTYRYKFDNTDLTVGATTVAVTSITPTLTDGPHTLYVQERDAAGNWSASGSASTVVMYGPASWYKFDGGDFTDYGFNKNNGIASAYSLVFSPRGNSNGAVSFDGTSFINLGTPTYLSATTTLSCWIKADSTAGGFPFWGQLLLYGGGGGGIALGVNDSNLATSGVTRNYTYASFTSGIWTHIAGTWDGTNLKLYVSGSYVSTHTFTGTGGYPELQGSSTIGTGNSSLFQGGAIDDLRVYNRILSDAEISSISSVSP